MRQNGTLSRRALLGGGLSLLAGSSLGAENNGIWRLTAEPLSGEAVSEGYNGGSPGPTIRAEVGRPCRILLGNKLARPTSLALQGVRASFAAAPLAPDETRETAFTPQEPGFGLYADPRGGGLFGAIVVEGQNPAADLDALAIFSLSEGNGELRANAKLAPAEWIAPPGARVRLRLANAAPDLVLPLKASAPVAIVAIDGQPCEMFWTRDGAFPLIPSARFELMFDMPEAGLVFAVGGAADQPALRFRASGARVGPRAPITALPANPRLPAAIALERALRARVVVTGSAGAGYKLNGAGRPDKPLFTAAQGTPVALTLVNQTAEAQTLRLEGQAARLLHALDDGWDPYWRDALFVAPGKTLHVAFVPDLPGRWPVASASPARREKGLAGWFLAT